MGVVKLVLSNQKVIASHRYVGHKSRQIEGPLLCMCPHFSELIIVNSLIKELTLTIDEHVIDNIHATTSHYKHVSLG